MPFLRRALSAMGRLARAAGRGLLTFLEIIGIRKELRVEQEAQLARFRLYHAEFRKLLSANNSFLETTAELEERLLSRDPVDASYLKRRTARLVSDVHHMLTSINVISQDRFAALAPPYDRITADLTESLAGLKPPAEAAPVLDLTATDASHAPLVGHKMAHLGELRNRLGLPTPDGFTVTAAAGLALFEENRLAGLIEKEHLTPHSPEDARRTSQALQDRILTLRPSPALSDSIFSAFDRLSSRLGGPPRLAVRSSALGEDTDLSFAGQFLTLLNVGREGLVEAYLRVLASLFSAEAVHYRMLHGLSCESAAMAVGCIAMVDAAASGVVFSNDPNRPEPGQVVVHAVRGLGFTLADGQSSPEEITLSRAARPEPLSRIPASQSARLVCRSAPGVEEAPVPNEEAGRPILREDQARQLAEWALHLERRFGGPQDIEWALAGDGRLFLLQARPLRIARDTLRTGKPVEGREVLVSGGETACGGVGIGPAVHLDEDADFEAFPQGAVLVTRRSSPKFVRLMDKARAIVSDLGSTTGHMASLAREFRVPALLNTRTATRRIPPGARVTVDADNGFVYAGEIPELAKKEWAHAAVTHSRRTEKEAALPPEIARVVDRIVPLNLTDPRSPDFVPDRCRTLHDLARFIHEKSYEEMFHLGHFLGDFRAASYLLDVFLPIDLYIIDLGGGVVSPPRGRKVKRRHITSTPLKALLRGMLHEKIPRFGPRPLDAGGFLSLVIRHALTNPESERTFRDPCYAMVSDVYLNYTARVGYHFGVVDAYCGKTANKNYINLLFRGGAADLIRRSRRAGAIAAILKELGFGVQLNRDQITARASKAATAETEERLDMVGRLLQFMRQMDLAMVSDEAAARVVKAFLEGDYGLKGP